MYIDTLVTTTLVPLKRKEKLKFRCMRVYCLHTETKILNVLRHVRDCHSSIPKMKRKIKVSVFWGCTAYKRKYKMYIDTLVTATAITFFL